MSRRDKRLNKKRVRNVIIVAIIAVFLIVVYRFGFLTRTESVVTAVFTEQGTEKTPLTASLTINQDTDGKYYVLLPDKVQSYKTSRFIKNNVTEEEPEEPEEPETVEPEVIEPETSNNETPRSLTRSSQTLESGSIKTSSENELQDINTPNNIDEQEIEKTENENTIVENTVETEVTTEESSENGVGNYVSDTNTVTNIITNETIETVENTVSENTVSNEVQNTITNEVKNNVVANEVENAVVNEVENVVENNVTSENKVETQTKAPMRTITGMRNSDGEPEESSTEYLPSTKYYLSDEEYNDKTINLDVVYSTKIVIDGEGTLTLYNQELENTIQSTGTIITISGFIPYDCSIECINMQNNVTTYIDGDEEYDEADMLLAYDISIVDSNGIEYEPIDYSESVKVKIVSDTELGGKLDGRNVWLRHFVLNGTLNEVTGEIENEELVDERISISYKKDNTIEFITDEFSPYAVFSFNPVLENTVTIDDYESDKNYYLGLNYTENGTGRAENNFYKEGENLAEVTINYHGYDYTEAPVPSDKYFQTATWSSTPTTEYYDVHSTTIGANQIIMQSFEMGSGLNRYYNDIGISFSSNEDLNMTDDPWTITLTFQNTNGNGFDSNTTRTANPGITFAASGNTLTLSGTSMNASGWTKQGTYYLLRLTLYFRNENDRNYLTYNNYMLNPNFVLGHDIFIGYKSTFTATIESPNIKLNTEADWTMSFDIPNASNFIETWMDALNTNVNFYHEVTNDSLILTGNSMVSDGWVVSGDTYTYSVTVIYANNYAITALPDNFMVRAVTSPVTGRISADANEKQYLITYIKCVPIENGNVSIDLIDNPFMDRPAGLGFDGWTTHEDGYTFTINGTTFVQTLTTAVDPDTKKVTIELYVDWRPATVIFVSSYGTDTNNNGYDINNPIYSLSRAKTVLDGGGYKVARNASNRELNIVVLLRGEYTDFNSLNTSSNPKAFTLTSLYDGNDYRNDARIIYTTSSVMYSDAQFDFLTITGNNYVNNAGTSNIDYYLVGNTYNIRLGRGIVPYNGRIRVNNRLRTFTGTMAQVQGGPNSASTINRREYRLVIESGLYQNIQIGRADYYFTTAYTASGTLVAGSDFDRINEDNTKLRIYNRTASRTCRNTVTGYSGKNSFTIIIKSGEFGRSYFDGRTGDYPYSGIYLGGHGYAVNDVGNRELIVEGGDIANIIGGLSTSSYNTNTAKTFIKVKGGSVQNIVGGAGISTTYGDRIIQVTGGEVAYSVAGGSNGFLATTPNDTNNGHMDGNTLVYIGGDAEIGTAGTSNSLYNATAGSVFGAGFGTTRAYTSGQVFTSHVIIDGDAIIHNNVYGGGNYGIVGTAGSAEQYTLTRENTNLNGNTYFISRYDDLSSGSYVLSANGTAVANGSYSTETVPPSTIQWTFENVSGNTYRIKNGNGYYLEAYAYSQFNRTYYALRLSNNPTAFTVQTSGTGVSIRYNLNGNKYVRYNNGWVYGNTSATLYLLKMHEIESGSNDLDVATTVDIIGGNIAGSVFGGANDNGSVNNAVPIQGSTVVNVSGGIINQSVYGGCNTSGNVAGAAKVTVSGGTIGTTASNSDVVFGGGKGSGTNILQRTSVNITDEDDNLNLYGSIYGGSALGTVTGTSEVKIQDISSEDNTITLTGDVYGGGKGEEGTAARSLDDVTVIVDGGSFPNSKVFGGCNVNGIIRGDVLVKIGETNSTFVNEVYGGGNQANITNDTTSDNVYIYENGTVNNVFNGGNQAGIVGTNERAVYVQGGTVLAGAYGGSNSSGTLEYTYVECSDEATVKNVYGGGKGNGTIISGDTEVLVKGSSTITDSVYGGGEGQTARVNGNTVVTINDNSIVNVNVYGGGNAGPTQGSTDVEISEATIEGSVFGGGKGSTATVSTDSDVNILTDAIIKENVYGGGDAGPLTRNTDVYVNEATVNGNVFGGGKGSTAVVGGDTVTLIENANIINDSSSTDVGNVYGGGDQGKVDGGTTVSVISSTIKNYVYGGGNQADIEENTSVALSDSATAKSVFGGGNAGEVGENTSVSLDNAIVTDNVYGGGNKGDVTGNTNVLISDSSITNSIFGGGKSADVGSTVVSVLNTVTTTNYTSKNVYGGGDQGETTGSTRVTITNANIENEVYGGGNGAENQTGTTVPGKVAGNTYVKLQDATSSNVFGGGNGKTAIVSGNTELIVEDSELIYSAGDSITGHVFGGGNNGPVSGSTKVGLTNAIVAKSAYAAGNGSTAVVSGNSYIYAEGTTTVGESIFGGGNAALTGDSSIPTPETDDNHPYASRYVTAIVDIAGAVVGQNVYGGANSSVIQGNTVVNVGLQAIDDFYNSDQGQDFTKGKNNFAKGKIDIGGTIFGGGESMDPTKPFNYDTVSVLGTINITVDGTGYDTSDNDTIQFNKSIFGSGNASRATGQTKTINIKHYGTIDSPKQGVSLQRATDVIVDASALWLSGTTDSTSLHPDGYFTLNQISALKLKNNGILYLRNGANKLASFYSLVDNPNTGAEEIATVNIVDKVVGSDGNTYYAKNGNIYNNAGTEIRYYIDDGKIIDNNTLLPVADVQEITYADRLERNVDNRIYIYSGINLNISNDEDANSEYGEVNGMTFFGLFRSNSSDSSEGDGSEGGGDGSGGETTGAGTEFNETDASLYTGMFNHNYSVGGALSWDDRNYNRSYVLGIHKENHDILVDGFYTVYERFNTEVPDDVEITENNYSSYNPTTYISYITPTPPGDAYYMWYAGPDQDVYYYSFNMTATKHSTFGTYELTLKNISFPNATVSMSSVETDLIDGVGLYGKNTIPNINLDQNAANNNFGITMKSGNTGWSMVGSTDFYYNPSTGLARYDGTEVYKIENSTTSPALSFYFYHSNNITEQRELGYFTVKMRLEYRKDAFNRGFADIIIDIALLTDTDQYMGYNGAIAPGVQYDLFTTTNTNITSKSSFSTFFEFAQENFYNQDKIADYYEDSYRVITTEYVYPVGTTITMIDRYDNNDPKYYYYVVSQADVNAGKNEFRLDEFKVMGSTDENYDEKRERQHYYIDSLGYEYENFIFISNFENAVFTDTPNSDGAITTGQHIRMYIKYDGEREEAEELVGLLDDQIGALVYGIYDSESTININANLSKSKIYLGNDVFLNVDTNYDVTIRGGSRVHDTRFFDKKLGTKLTFYYQNDDDEWDVVKGSELLGLYFELDGIKYYPSADGTTRIKIADLVSNATSAIKIGTENCSIDSNRYRIKVESFGSADGMYYGIEASDYAYVYLEIINDVYGLDVSIEPQQAVIDTSTGKVLEGNIENIGYIAAEEHKLNFTVDYLSGLARPYITISLYRRMYDNVYDNSYEKVDLQDYVVETLETPIEADRTVYSTEEDAEYLDSIKQFEYEYKAFDTAKIASVVGDDNTNSVSFTDLELTLKDTLKTGTYKVEFMLYDTYPDVATNVITDDGGNNTAKNYNITTYEYIGESFTYIIIK